MLTEYKEKMVNKMSLLSTEGLSSLLARQCLGNLAIIVIK